MGNQPHESLSDYGQANELAPISPSSDATEPTDVAVVETIIASPHLACPVEFADLIDTSSIASSNAHTPYDTSTIPVLTSVQLRRLWYPSHGGRTRATTLIVILLSGLSGFLTAGTFLVVAMAIAAPDPPARRRLTFEGNMEMIGWFTCVAFFGSIYLTGQLLYRMLGQKAELERVQELSRQHMPLLWFVAGLYVAGQPGMNVSHGKAIPRDWLLLTVGLLILAYSVRGILIAVRSRVPYTWLLSRR
jgi:hypothetical protein